MVIPLLLLASLPATGPDQIEWTVRATYEHGEAGQACVTTPAQVRDAVNRLGSQKIGGKPLFEPEQLKAWLASKSFTTPKDGERSKQWPLEARTGTYIMVTVHNAKHNLSMETGAAGAATWVACSGYPRPNNAGGIALPAN